MSQGRTVGDLEQSVGYALKQAAAALRTAMDAALRPLGPTVPQYSCLELLGRRPGLSGAEPARSAFVTRRSMHSRQSTTAATTDDTVGRAASGPDASTSGDVALDTDG